MPGKRVKRKGRAALLNSLCREIARKEEELAKLRRIKSRLLERPRLGCRFFDDEGE